jgi:hypothetical protein
MGYEVILYNGYNGFFYNRTDLSSVPTTTISVKYNYTVVPFKQIANGMEGIALKAPSGKVIEFISYEGTFMAKNGPAKGMTSTDVIVSESNICTAAGFSLQKCSNNGLWIGPKRATPGKLNRNCTGLVFPKAQKMPPCVIMSSPVQAPVKAPVMMMPVTVPTPTVVVSVPPVSSNATLPSPNTTTTPSNTTV